MNKLNLDFEVPLWSWNGYNSQWVSTVATKELAEQEALFFQSKFNPEEVQLVVAEDDLYFTIHCQREYDFYGWRTETAVYTTRPGVVVSDYADHLSGTWVPAAFSEKQMENGIDLT